MARTDQLTGKKTRFGGNRKHRRGSSGAGGTWRFKSQRTLRTWKINGRMARVVKNGKVTRVKVAMSTYNKLRKGSSVNGYKLAPTTNLLLPQ